MLIMAYRSAVQETTGFSPCELMLGRSINLLIDLLLGTPDPPEHQPEVQSEYAAKLGEHVAGECSLKTEL